jgi:hypothetical protein
MPKFNLVSLRPIVGRQVLRGLLAVVMLTDAPEVAAHILLQTSKTVGQKIRKAPMSFSRYTGLTHEVGR